MRHRQWSRSETPWEVRPNARTARRTDTPLDLTICYEERLSNREVRPPDIGQSPAPSVESHVSSRHPACVGCLAAADIARRCALGHRGALPSIVEVYLQVGL